MYQVGEMIIYGSNGVCRVENVGAVEVSGLSKDKIYYTLKPVYSNGGTVFTPVDNNKVIMRPVISKKEALELIEQIDDVELLEVSDEKKREIQYKEVLKSCDCRQWIRIIKTLHWKNQTRLKAGKKTTASDEKYLRLAEQNLYGELAYALEMDKSQVGTYIEERVGQTQS